MTVTQQPDIYKKKQISLYIMILLFKFQYYIFHIHFIQVIKNLAKPADDWGPVSKEHRTERKMIDGTPTEQFESQIPFVGSQYSAEQDTKV